MSEKELTLREFAGQNKDVKITKRKDGSKYVTFETSPGYGNPSLEEGQIEELLATLRKL